MRRALAFLAVVALAGSARADKNDLVLSRLGQTNATMSDVVPFNQDFRSLVSELGVVIAPKFLSPADTLGYSGFQFSAETSWTTINSNARYWCATEESDSCTGAAGQKGSDNMQTLSLFARKGLWLPLPSFEFGAGALHVLDSTMWAGQIYGKLALHEGFHDWPIPSVAARGAASRLFGSEQLDLTVASLDISVSKSIGVQGTVNLEPYAGWNYLWIIPRSEVIDKTPNIDAFTDPSGLDLRMNFVFPDQDNITRQRLFAGLKVRYYVFALTLEANFALAGSSVDDRATNVRCDNQGDDEGSCDASDQAGGQESYSISLSLDF
jgi:hypothetical protein